ncbi:glutamyl-Q tRNA(Asp) synthetase [Desulfuromusa kysingii]|uniref:Glutamyl-Q tRNA(Asp) synthetase n=1 Tax=Desulfuromusa kysingii TaxID=37625 RepID=A0A1H3XGB0_9BACT|nr:tRNA glutamyl-Q(34) synthetase GluQRS [Desulfuromusa kysingii]SDZ98465.1 glutamyl-Q tRNA(Asp) synthetase [Desulfuromusa kysingii]
MQLNQRFKPVIGRFAPSPTGPLHFGTLLAALGSYLLAKCSGGSWLLRIEDLDPPRVVPGAAERMIRLIESLGFEWDGKILYQSQRYERYRQVLAQLRDQGQVFDCCCTRREILASAPHPEEEAPVYPGTCREGLPVGRVGRAVRLRVSNENIHFDDGVYGRQQQNLETDVGDFILHRADGLFAYQLAVVVDDIDTGVTQVVRGADLLSSTPRQIHLYRCLHAAIPDYFHLPLALADNGKKLSKRHGDVGLVSEENGVFMLCQALEFLGQAPPEALLYLSTREVLQWGLDNFQASAIPAKSSKIRFSAS